MVANMLNCLLLVAVCFWLAVASNGFWRQALLLLLHVLGLCLLLTAKVQSWHSVWSSRCHCFCCSWSAASRLLQDTTRQHMPKENHQS